MRASVAQVAWRGVIFGNALERSGGRVVFLVPCR